MTDKLKEKVAGTWPDIADDPRIKKIDDALDQYGGEDGKKPKTIRPEEALQMCDETLNDLMNAASQEDIVKKAHAYIHKGAVYYRMGQHKWKDAAKMYAEAEKLNPKDPDLEPSKAKLPQK